MSKQITNEMLGEILMDFVEHSTDPRIDLFDFGLRMDDANGFLDLGFVPNADNHAVELDVQYTNATESKYDGAQEPADVRFYMGISNNQWRTGLGSAYYEHGVASIYRNRHVLVGNGQRFINDILVLEKPNDISTQTGSFYLWGRGGTTYHNPGIIYYGVKVFDGNVLIKDLVAVKGGTTRYSSNPAPEHCFWDKVNEVYVTPSVPAELVVVRNYNTQDLPVLNVGSVSISTELAVEFKTFIETHVDLVTSGFEIDMNMVVELADFIETYVTHSETPSVELDVGMFVERTDLTFRSENVTQVSSYHVDVVMNAELQDL